MGRLVYIFCLSGLILAGCSQPVRMYRPEFLAQETATFAPAGAVFEPPVLAYTNDFGGDEIAGQNLNQRNARTATSGWYDLAEARSYYIRLYERHPDRSPNDGYLNRTVNSYSGGVQVR